MSKHKTKLYQKKVQPAPQGRKRTLPDPLAYARHEPKPTEKFVDAPLTSKAHTKYLRGYAARRAGAPATFAVPTAAPRRFDALDIMARHARRWCIPLDALPDRIWLDLHNDCQRAANALTAWAARQEQAA